MGRPSEEDGTQDVGLLAELWRTSAWRIFPMLLLYVASLTILFPAKPSLLTNFFASLDARFPLRCEEFQLEQQPKPCMDAHSKVMIFISGSDFVAYSVFSFVLSPMVGRWSDVYGRKPFLLLSLGCAGAPILVLALHVHRGLSLFYLFPAQALFGAFSTISISLAYTADLLPPRHRAPAFGFVLASFSLGILLGPLLGGAAPLGAAAWAAVTGMAACWAFVALCMPESLPLGKRRLARQRQVAAAKGAAAPGPLHGLAMLWRSSLFRRLTACVMLTGVVAEGMYELLAQYFQLKLGFSITDQANMYVVAGSAGLLVNTFLLRWLLHAVGAHNVLMCGTFASMVQMVLIAFAQTKKWGIGAVALASAGNMAFPAISAIKANNVQHFEQGAMQGALYGARSLAQGTGPVLFAAVFTAFSRTDSRLPYFPGAPFILGGVLSLGAFLIAASIDRDAAAHVVPQLSADFIEPAPDDEESSKCGTAAAAPLLPSVPDPTGLATRRSVDVASAHAAAGSGLAGTAGAVPVLARAESVRAGLTRNFRDPADLWVLPKSCLGGDGDDEAGLRWAWRGHGGGPGLQRVAEAEGYVALPGVPTAASGGLESAGRIPKGAAPAQPALSCGGNASAGNASGAAGARRASGQPCQA